MFWQTPELKIQLCASPTHIKLDLKCLQLTIALAYLVQNPLETAALKVNNNYKL